jgi:hypothetical protein
MEMYKHEENVSFMNTVQYCREGVESGFFFFFLE